MLTVTLDPGSELAVRWPKKDAQTIELGTAYVAQERKRKASERVPVPTLENVEAALEAAREAASSAQGGEAERASSAEAVSRALAEAMPLLEEAITHLKSRNVKKLANLEQWGLETKTGKKGVTVSKPKAPQEWKAFLAAYVQKETSLDPKSRLQEPALERLAELAGIVASGGAAKAAGKTQRKVGVQTRKNAAQGLLDLLQAGAVVLVTQRFAGKVTRELEQWGYTVSAAGMRKAKPETPA